MKLTHWSIQISGIRSTAVQHDLKNELALIFIHYLQCFLVYINLHIQIHFTEILIHRKRNQLLGSICLMQQQKCLDR